MDDSHPIQALFTSQVWGTLIPIIMDGIKITMILYIWVVVRTYLKVVAMAREQR